MSDSKWVKAVIINLDKNDQHVSCMFNPKEYTFSKSNDWAIDPTASSNIPKITFNHGASATLQMQLFFDTYTENENGGTPKDVRAVYTDKIWELMMVDEDLRDPKSQKARPPMVRFQWGKTWSFDAVIQSITQRFTLFAADGTPARAVLDVHFTQVKDTKQLRPQNPTSGGSGGERTWVVKEGDTLQWIAHKSYGDATRWRPIAQANRLTHVRDLTPGTVLEVPNA